MGHREWKKKGEKMKIVEQKWDWLQWPPGAALKTIERAGRVCYQSGHKIRPGSDMKFVKTLLKRGHVTPIEHISASVVAITDRGVTHELVRHRIASFSQESTRYVGYDGNMEFIKPAWWDEWSTPDKQLWIYAMTEIERIYKLFLESGNRPEQARTALPNSLKSEIVVTANLRQWMHIFKMRCAKDAHPQIRALFRSILAGFHGAVPVIFDSLAKKYLEEKD